MRSRTCLTTGMAPEQSGEMCCPRSSVTRERSERFRTQSRRDRERRRCCCRICRRATGCSPLTPVRAFPSVRSSPLFAANTVTFVEGPTQRTLPKFDFVDRHQLVLLDGPHGYPFPDLEYFYLYPTLDTGGLLIIDDIRIPSVRRMFDIIGADDMFETLEVVDGNTAFLRRTDAPLVHPESDSWWLQGYNGSYYTEITGEAPARESDGVMSVAIAVPSLNQRQFLGPALDSLGRSDVRVVRAVLDAGSTDGSRDLVEARASELAYWRSEPDAGQAAAVNEGIARLCALHPDVEAVGWLNSDDVFLPGGVDRLWQALVDHPDWLAACGRATLLSENGEQDGEIPTEPFSPERFARACTICQPATLVRRSAWERVGGLDASLHMCFDYDLWWRIGRLGTIGYVDAFVAASRDHGETKTRRHREQYFRGGHGHRAPRTPGRAMALVHQPGHGTPDWLRGWTTPAGVAPAEGRSRSRLELRPGATARPLMARIVHVCPMYFPARGGVEQFFLRLSEHLAKQGHDVTVWTTDARVVRGFTSPAEPRFPKADEQLNGVRVRRFPVRHVPAQRFLRTAAHVLPFGVRWKCDTLRWTPWVPSMTREAGRSDRPAGPGARGRPSIQLAAVRGGPPGRAQHRTADHQPVHARAAARRTHESRVSVTAQHRADVQGGPDLRSDRVRESHVVCCGTCRSTEDHRRTGRGSRRVRGRQPTAVPGSAQAERRRGRRRASWQQEPGQGDGRPARCLRAAVEPERAVHARAGWLRDAGLHASHGPGALPRAHRQPGPAVGRGAEGFLCRHRRVRSSELRRIVRAQPSGGGTERRARRGVRAWGASGDLHQRSERVAGAARRSRQVGRDP